MLMSTSNKQHERVGRTKYVSELKFMQRSYPELKGEEKAGKYLHTGKK